MKKQSNKHEILEALKVVVDGLAQTFGTRCEVVLHDLKNPHRSVIKIANGHVTGRQVGSPITDYGLKLLTPKNEDTYFLNYSTTANDGRQLKSSSILFRDEKNKPFAALCINFDVSDILNLNTIIKDIFKITDVSLGGEPIETFQNDFSSMLTNAIDKTIKTSGKSVPAMKMEDRKKIVAELHSQGIFSVKGAVKTLSEKLGVSKFTIYSYLDAVRGENESKKKPSRK